MRKIGSKGGCFKIVTAIILVLFITLSAVPVNVLATEGEPVVKDAPVTPEEKKPAPEEKEPAPEEKEPVPEEKEPAPEEKEPVPEEKEPAPEEKEPAPEEKEPAPEAKEPAPNGGADNGFGGSPFIGGPLGQGNPGEQTAITLFQEGEDIGHFDTIKQVIDKMYALTQDGSRYNFTIQVNKDIELTEYSQFGFPYGEVTLTSEDPANPRIIKAAVTDHHMMLGVVNGTHLTIENIIIDGNNQKRILWVESSENDPASLTINEGTILQNGKVEESDQTKVGGAIYGQKACEVTINGGIIRNNEAIQAGGAICLLGTGTLTINGGEIYANKVPIDSGYGGAIVLQRQGVINGGKIYGNSAYHGGAIAAGKDANLAINGGEISNNEAGFFGGGVYSFMNSVVKFSSGQISKNKSLYGAGVTTASSSNFIMEGRGIISENEASKGGGGVYLFENSVVKFSSGQISKNISPFGGGVAAGSKSNFIMDGTGVISENNASQSGGGLYLWGTTPACDLISGTIEKNQSPYGGGVRVRSAKAKIGSVTIQENEAAFGGGIYCSIPAGESITIDGVKLINNQAPSGGGICLPESGILNIVNAELTGNQAYYGGGIWTMQTMTLKNCTFDANEAVKSEGTNENNGHGGAIYVQTKLPEDGVVTVDGCTFRNNKADKSGGAISVDETRGLLNVVNGTSFIGNQATGEWGHGGALYSNLHAYIPDYDDGSTGGLVQPPTPKNFYYNINTDATTVFTNNKAFKTFTPPSTKDEFVKLLYYSTSHPGTKYDHPLNNDDINLIFFCEVIFHLNYNTPDPIYDGFLLIEDYSLGEAFPTNPTREGHKFLGWNTQQDGHGTAFTADTIVDKDMIVYAIWEEETQPDTPEPRPTETPEPRPTETPESQPTVSQPINPPAVILPPVPEAKLSVSTPIVFKTISGGEPAIADLFTNEYVGPSVVTPTQKNITSLPATGSRDSFMPALGLVAIGLALVLKKRFR